MIDEETINEKLESLKEYVGYLKGYQKSSLEQLKTDHTLQGAVRYYFQLASECIIDISEIIISSLGLKRPDTAQESIEVLGAQGILPQEFSIRISKIAGFRNILVHEYARVDINEVYEHLQRDLEDFTKFAQLISNWLRGK
ncbi:MAG: DUF86 domain-containing protein [Candidatus Omnitrophica bacterium]|nr:DUF86 domain-containing protein [Candidatus Omnitrophota bacterium]